MEPASIPPERDSEFRPPGASASRRAVDFGPADYQRLVANPFLGLFGLLAWLAGARLMVERLSPAWSILAGLAWFALGLRVLPRLLHYHCRDCGTSGPLRRWKEHACAAVLERRWAGRRRAFRGPSPPTQVVVWAYLLLALAVVLGALI